ncbi:MAG: GNAT family N-acetyltransferase [Planctomycetaceae bacterium]|nr:GNAT family N-acetyltransferase [Planctomycetaceae bacterium]
MTNMLNAITREGEAPAEPLGQLDVHSPIGRTRTAFDHALTLRIEPWSELLHAQWRDLERRLGDVPLAVSSGWTASWVGIYGDMVDVRVAIAERAGRICGLALLSRSRAEHVGPFRLATCHIGTAGEGARDSVCVEYNDLLCDDSCRAEFAARLMELATGSRGADEIRLDGFDETSARELLADLPDVELTLRASRYCDLQAIRERGTSVMDALGGSTRSSLRRALRKTGDVEVTAAASLDEADDIFTELLELHQARWRAAGQPGAFASTRFLAFQRELITRLLPEERVVLLRVRSQALTIGCLMLLVDRGRLLDYLSGFAPFDQTPSPGIVTHYLAMERALANGHRAYDFLVGDKRHKENLANASRNLIWATWRRPNLKNRTLAGLRQVKRALAAARERKSAAVSSGEAGE